MMDIAKLLEPVVDQVVDRLKDELRHEEDYYVDGPKAREMLADCCESHFIALKRKGMVKEYSLLGKKVYRYQELLKVPHENTKLKLIHTKR